MIVNLDGKLVKRFKVIPNEYIFEWHHDDNRASITPQRHRELHNTPRGSTIVTTTTWSNTIWILNSTYE